MKKLFMLCVTTLLCYSSNAQTCLINQENDYFFQFPHIFSNQTEIDSFIIKNPDCTIIESDVQIGKPHHCCDGIYNLSGFKNITHLKGSLSIVDLDDLTTLKGFEKLKTIDGDLTIRLNSNLISLKGFESLESIGGSTTINFNKQLIDLNGLEKLRFTEKIFIVGNDSLRTIESLSNVESIEDIRITGNENLTLCSLDELCNFLYKTTKAPSISFNGQNCNLEDLFNDCNLFKLLPNTCLLGSHNFNSQKMVDDFALENPNCTNIYGDITLFGDSILNLEGLQNIQSINGQLNISVTKLRNLKGLENLISCNDIAISGNEFLEDIADLGKLKKVENFKIFNNTHLKSIDEFNHLNTIGALYIRGNSELKYIVGFENLLFSDPNLLWSSFRIFDNPALQTITGFNRVKAIGCKDCVETRNTSSNLFGFLIQNNPSLTKISGFDSLKTIYGDFKIEENNFLDSLTAFKGLNNVFGFVSIKNSPKIKSLHFLKNLDSVKFDLSLDSLNFPDLKGLSNLTCINRQLVIKNNNSLLSLKGFEKRPLINSISIVNNPLLKNLEGLEKNNVDIRSLRVQSNDSFTDLAALNNYISLDRLALSSNPSLKNLNGLENLTSLGALSIGYNNNLENLLALQNLSSLNYLLISKNESLKDLSGFGKLKSLWQLEIRSNNTLKNFIGLEDIDTIQRFYLSNVAIENFKDLKNLRHLDYLQVANSYSLQDFKGLEGIEKLERLEVIDNPSIVSLTGLENLDSVKWVNINQNELLTDISAIPNILNSQLSRLYIQDNSSLSKCSHQNICEYLNGNGIAFVSSNANGCNSEDEILNDCVLSVQSTLSVSVYPNPANTFVKIEGVSKYSSFTIYNSIGNLIKSGNFNNGNTIEVSNFSTGIYFMTIDFDGYSIIRKLIVD